MKVLIIIIIILLCLFVLYCANKESFFIEKPCHKINGINLLGAQNDEDAHFLVNNASICKMICGRNPECKAYSFHPPSKSCYLWQTGQALPSKICFESGVKV